MYWLVKPAHRHTYFLFEVDHRRLQKSLSDLGGSDVYAHNGTVKGVLREISNALITAKRRPTMMEMLKVLEQVRDGLDEIMTASGAITPYSALSVSMPSTVHE